MTVTTRDDDEDIRQSFPLVLPSFQKVFRRHLVEQLQQPIPRSCAYTVIPDDNRSSASGSSDSPPGIQSRRGMCQFAEGCAKRARRGGLCVAHGGGRRCANAGCDKAVQTGGKPGRCFAHGGGKRCIYNNCSSGAVRQNYCRRHMYQVGTSKGVV